MKLKLIILFILIYNISYSQSSVKGSHERYRRGFFSSIFSKRQKSQMNHFDKPIKDPLIKMNGTSYRRDRKLTYEVDGSGFSMPTQGKRENKKKRTKRLVK